MGSTKIAKFLTTMMLGALAYTANGSEFSRPLSAPRGICKIEVITSSGKVGIGSGALVGDTLYTARHVLQGVDILAISCTGIGEIPRENLTIELNSYHDAAKIRLPRAYETDIRLAAEKSAMKAGSSEVKFWGYGTDNTGVAGKLKGGAMSGRIYADEELMIYQSSESYLFSGDSGGPLLADRGEHYDLLGLANQADPGNRKSTFLNLRAAHAWATEPHPIPVGGQGDGGCDLQAATQALFRSH